MAQVLLNDFLADASGCSQVNATHFLRARFGHAETIMPFVALLKIPLLSDKQTPLGDTYTYANNDWRGELVSPMSANVQWEIYRRRDARTAAPADVLVRMLLNEHAVPFKEECKAYSAESPLFYTLEELTRCYGDVDG